MKFIKKPVVIEAFRMGIDTSPDWFQLKVIANEITIHAIYDRQDETQSQHKPQYCIINTLEGKMKGDYGDYIIKGVKGEIYACKPDIFKLTYDIYS